MKKLFTLATSVMLGVCAVFAQNAPVFHKYSFDDAAIINGMSDNGEYAVANGFSAENSMIQKGARLIEIDTDKVTDLAQNYSANDYMSMGTTDVTDDGSIVVGEFNHFPAYWSKSTGKWTLLPCEEAEYWGDVRSITPDGKYAVGRQSIDEDGFYALPALWDLTTNTLLEVEGIPEFDMSGHSQDQNWFNQITPDGKLILGSISFSYVQDGFYYIYDVENKSFKPIGFTLEGKKFTPVIDNLLFINSATFSNNGKWVTGRAYMLERDGNTITNQYETTYVYNVETEDFEIYKAAEDIDVVASAIDNSGHPYAATPSGTPVRECSIRNGAYWYSFEQILQQQYGIDFTAKTGYDNTGTVLFVSNDEKRATIMVDPYTSYVLEMPTTFFEASKGIDLLGSYTTYPHAGATISRLKEVTINFDRDVQILGGNNCAQIRDEQGNTVYNSVGVSANKKKVTVRFRSGALEADKKYALHIPAGSIALIEDAKLSNKEINIAYNGRIDSPVRVTDIYPTANTSIAKIDNNTNPITLTFNVEVFAPDSAIGYLYKEGDDQPMCKLLVGYLGRKVALYPATPQYLFLDNSYRVELMPGSVTDVAGNGANEKIVINYMGSYEREIVFDDNSLFIEDFNTAGVANLLLWDGDRNEPAADAQAIGFDRNDYGWCIVWDEEDPYNLAASSHSMYTPAGKSNDWMVVPQLYIPDEKCSLNFKSQSYMNIKKDNLKVYVWEQENIINLLDDNIVNRIKNEGELIYDQLQSPGLQEGLLAGDWTENSIKLDKYAGKYIYIAFLNDNEAQSAVFVDDILVSHNKPVRVAFTHPTTVINEKSIAIEGVISIESETDVYNTLTLTLKDSEGNEIDKITESGLELKKGDTRKFTFNKELPLTSGNVNKFTVSALCNESLYEVTGKISNLAFEPIKRIVLEEFSGRSCVNCPLGIVGIENLIELYGDLIVPICIRTYSDDPLGTGLAEYSAFLGFAAAPSANINRKGISMPAVSSNGGYYFSNAQLPEGTQKLWQDVVADEMLIPTEADINISLSVDEATNEFVIPVTVRYAMNASNLNLSLFTVVMEDYVEGWQMNGFASVESDVLGEWSKGGIYAKPVVYDYPNMDICRSYAGATFNGTGGLFPQEMIAGEEYNTELRVAVPQNIEKLSNAKVAVMLIDANTGYVVNAAHTGDITAVESIDTNASVAIGTTKGCVVVNTQEYAQVEVYGINGMLMGVAKGDNRITLDSPAGIAIVKVVTANEVVVKKVLVK